MRKIIHGNVDARNVDVDGRINQSSHHTVLPPCDQNTHELPVIKNWMLKKRKKSILAAPAVHENDVDLCSLLHAMHACEYTGQHTTLLLLLVGESIKIMFARFLMIAKARHDTQSVTV